MLYELTSAILPLAFLYLVLYFGVKFYHDIKESDFLYDYKKAQHHEVKITE